MIARAPIGAALSAATLLLGCLSLLGCGASSPPTGQVEVAQEPDPEPSRDPGAPTLSEGVLQMENGCVEGAVERLNALDDDCDGAIDEGPERHSGPVQIALAWNNGADLDLYVTEPGGFTLSYQSRQSDGDGHFEHDARGDCAQPAQEAEGGRMENVYFGPEAAPGAYQVEVHHFAACGSEGPATASLSVSVRGTLLGTYNLSLDPGQRVPVLRFEL